MNGFIKSAGVGLLAFRIGTVLAAPGTQSPPPTATARGNTVPDISGGRNQDLSQACSLVMATAKVAYATRTDTAGPAPTLEMALGGEDRSDWERCSEFMNKAAPQDGPWGNGVPPIVEIRPGPASNDAGTCSRNFNLLTSMVSSCIARHSLSRRYMPSFDNSQPTCAFIGGACMTSSFYGNADMFAPLMTPAPTAKPAASPFAWGFPPLPDPWEAISSISNAASSWFFGSRTTHLPWNSRPTSSPNVPWGRATTTSTQNPWDTQQSGNPSNNGPEVPWQPQEPYQPEPGREPYRGYYPPPPQYPNNQNNGGDQYRPDQYRPDQYQSQPYRGDDYPQAPYGSGPITSVVTVTVSAAPTTPAPPPRPSTPATQTITITLSAGQGF